MERCDDAEPMSATGHRHRRRPTSLVHPSLRIRVLVWIVATPVAFAVSLLVAKQIGLFTSSRLLDAALNQNFASYRPFIIVGLVCALLNAVAVHGAIELLASRRRRARRG